MNMSFWDLGNDFVESIGSAAMYAALYIPVIRALPRLIMKTNFCYVIALSWKYFVFFDLQTPEIQK